MKKSKSLFINGYKPEVIFAQNMKYLGLATPAIRLARNYQYSEDTKDIAKAFDIEMIIADHDSDKVIKRAKSLDLGIILGARILKEKTINSFKVGILNMHPGIIPLNSGIDSIKWAVLKGIKQGVTTHLIDKYVDRGSIIDRKILDVYPMDSLSDIYDRSLSLQQSMMIEAVKIIESGYTGTKLERYNEKNIPMTADTELAVIEKLFSYKIAYSSMEGI